MHRRPTPWLLVALFVSLAPAGATPAEQNPSPMVEHTRAHPRLKDEKPEGRREKLTTGTLFIPKGVQGERVPLFVHFHGAPWLAEVAAAKWGKAAVITVNLGSGSAAYARPFANPEAFPALLKEAETKAGVRFGQVGLTAWSAGYGAVREILKADGPAGRVSFVLLLDGLHAGYEGGKPGPLESKLVAADLEPFLRFARDAAAGKKQLIVTHSEVFPGTFASTTETADYLLREVGVKRTAVLRWGPMGTQQLSEARRGKLLVAGFAGNSAPDHVDHLHALPEFLAWVGDEAGGEAVRIVALGDSITRGTRPGVKDDETFAALLQAALRKEGGRAEMTNAGVGGERTDGALQRLEKAVLAAKPRFVLVMYGTNDS
jgi:hypothetical protein